MCLSVAVHRPDCVVAKGIHASHEWNIVHNGTGHLCGYVKVEEGHPWHGKDYLDVDAVVHGGLTFADADVPCEQGGPDSGYWLGFDCAHAGDRAIEKYFNAEHKKRRDAHPDLYGPFPWEADATVKDEAYVEAECRRLCEQARDASL